MKKIKTAEKYLKKYEGEIVDAIGDNFYQTVSYQIHEEIIKDIIKQAQLDMLEYAVNKAANNSRTMDDPYSYTGNTGSEYPPDIIVDKQSILKTIDEIKKELE